MENKSIKKITKFIKKYPGEVMTVLGTGIFTYNIFNFSFTDSTGRRLPRLEGGDSGNVAYYYTEETLFLIALGAMLIVAGILIIKRQK